MMDDATPETEVICPVCGQTMTYLHRFRSAFHGTFDEFRCKSCNYLTTFEVKVGMAG
jgi:transposase-like protein